MIEQIRQHTIKTMMLILSAIMLSSFFYVVIGTDGSFNANRTGFYLAWSLNLSFVFFALFVSKKSDIFYYVGIFILFIVLGILIPFIGFIILIFTSFGIVAVVGNLILTILAINRFKERSIIVFPLIVATSLFVVVAVDLVSRASIAASRWNLLDGESCMYQTSVYGKAKLDTPLRDSVFELDFLPMISESTKRVWLLASDGSYIWRYSELRFEKVHPKNQLPAGGAIATCAKRVQR